jgi:peptide/nickel transport system ATP-binding protein
MAMTPSPAPLLDVKHLNVLFNTPRGLGHAVRDLSFSLARGQTLGLVGESGCGKSITALSLLGLLPDAATASGSITLQGQELVGQADDVLRHIRGNRIGMIFQEPMTALNPVHRIGHQVAEPLRLHRQLPREEARQQAIALLDRVGIPDATRRFDAYPHQFSGGQRQRITIAMALACNPDILIADEPTTALDVTIQGQILDLIADLVQERGMALILISHDLGVIAHNVQQMMVMYGGTVVESGATADVFKHRAHPYTRGLFAARPQWQTPKGTRLATIAGSVPELIDLPAGCAFSDRCSFAVKQCVDERPQPVSIGQGHTARCFRINEVAALADREAA